MNWMSILLSVVLLISVISGEEAVGCSYSRAKWMTSNIKVNIGLLEKEFAPAFVEALNKWNDVLSNTDTTLTTDDQSGDPCEFHPELPNCCINGVKFAPTLCGNNWNDGVAASTLTWIRKDDNALVQSGIVFNSNLKWGIYSGSLLEDTVDFNRVTLHEIGHMLGLAHEFSLPSIMYYTVTNLDHIMLNDMICAKNLYLSSDVDFTPVANLSARGVADLFTNNLVVEFSILRRTKVAIRVLGPTLGKYGVKGYLPNPTLFLYSSRDGLISENDDWEKHINAIELRALKLTPGDPREPAMVLDLEKGIYRIVVKPSSKDSSLDSYSGIVLAEIFHVL